MKLPKVFQKTLQAKDNINHVIIGLLGNLDQVFLFLCLDLADIHWDYSSL